MEGTLINVPMQLVGDLGGGFEFLRTHDVYSVVRVPDSEEDSLDLSQSGVRFEAGTAMVVHPGEDYHLPAGRFHASLHLGTTVTIMERDPDYRGGGLARVACRINETPDNSWVRAGHAIPDWAADIIRKYV